MEYHDEVEFGLVKDVAELERLNARAIERYSASTTHNAQAFNDMGVRPRTNVWVELWNLDDPVATPRRVLSVASSIRPGKIASFNFNAPGVYAVFQQWYWQEKKQWFKTLRERPAPIFGPRAYFSSVAIFWFDQLPSVTCGGTIEQLPNP
jgi:hypothetical protein